MKYTHIPTGIKSELVRFGVNCNWKGIVGEASVTINSSG